MFNKRTNYDRNETNDVLSSLDRDIAPETAATHSTPAAQTAKPESEPVAARSGGETVLAEGCSFTGKANVSGTLRVEGRAQGEVKATDTVVVGRTGRLEANVVTNRAVFSGSYHGRVEARDRVELQNGSRVEGDIVATNMVMEDGVLFKGNCQVGAR